MEQTMPEQLEMLNRICASETSHPDFMNYDVRLSTLEMRGLAVDVFFAGDYQTAARKEDR
jgi:hypothetical protein